MRQLDLGRTFDAVICMFSSIGHLTNPDDMREAFRRLPRHLAPGGVLIVDGWVLAGMLVLTFDRVAQQIPAIVDKALSPAEARQALSSGKRMSEAAALRCFAH